MTRNLLMFLALIALASCKPSASGGGKEVADDARKGGMDVPRDEKGRNLSSKLYVETVTANLSGAALYEIRIHVDGSWQLDKDGKTGSGTLTPAQLGSFEKELAATTVKAVVPKGTCAGLPHENIRIEARNSVAEFADECAAEPDPSLAKLRATVHTHVGL